MNFYVGLAIVAALAGGALYIHNDAYQAGIDYQKAQEKSQDDLLAKVEEKAQVGAAAEIAKITPKYVTIQGKVQHEIETRTVYRDCVHTPDAFRLLNDALTNAPEAAASEPARPGELPASDAAR